MACHYIPASPAHIVLLKTVPWVGPTSQSQVAAAHLVLFALQAAADVLLISNKLKSLKPAWQQVQDLW